MGELYNPFPKLPKNIRQIGDRDDVVKLYVEDYVNTYLKRLYPVGGQDLRVGLLLGNVENHEGTPYIFIDGALEMEDVALAGEKVIFSESAWKKAYQSIEETFPKRTVQGWFLCGAPGCALSPLNYWKQHSQYFGGKNQLMYLNSGIDGDESLYITSDDGFYRLKGYSVYYERNQMMQDYMILRKDAHRVETGTNDRVIRDFRQRMEGRKREATSRNGTIHMLGMLCSALAVAVLAGGVVMFNNYQKMRDMEGVLVSVLPSGVKNWKDYGEDPAGDELIVETVKGKVYPIGDTGAGNSGQAPQQTAEGEGLAQDGAGAGAAAGQADGWTLSGEEQLAGGKPLTGESQLIGESQQIGENQQTGGKQQTGESQLTGGKQQTGESQLTGGKQQTGESQLTGKNQLSGENRPAKEGTSQMPGVAAAAGAGQSSNEASGDAKTAEGDEGAEGGQAAKGGQAAGGQKQEEDAVKKDYPVTNMKPGKAYVVGEGETLYGICFKLYGSIRYLDDICALNKLDDVDKIISGQELVLPDTSGN